MYKKVIFLRICFLLSLFFFSVDLLETKPTEALLYQIEMFDRETLKEETLVEKYWKPRQVDIENEKKEMNEIQSDSK